MFAIRPPLTMLADPVSRHPPAAHPPRAALPLQCIITGVHRQCVVLNMQEISEKALAQRSRFTITASATKFPTHSRHLQLQFRSVYLLLEL